MEDFETTDPEYVRGFNDGYLLSKHMPELASALDKLEKGSPRLQGFSDGRNEYYQERGKVLFNAMGHEQKDVEHGNSKSVHRKIDKDER